MKKLLALVLALVMTLGLATVGTNAAFSDADSIKYEEAVDVMSAIGVIAGMDNGAFNPTGTLTREQGAKIISYMLMGGKTAGDALTASKAPFTDVAADRWSAGAIAYCANAGILAGVGDGKFDPTGALTGAAFAKMLLTALGYNAQTEGLVGADYMLNTVRLVNKIDLANGLGGLSYNGAITRDEAAKLAFNTLTEDVVEYLGTFNVKTSDGTEVSNAVQATAVANASYSYLSSAADGTGVAATNGVTEGGTLAATGKMQFCENYFPNLKVAAGTDAFGVPSNFWFLATKRDDYKFDKTEDDAIVADASADIVNETFAAADLTYGDLYKMGDFAGTVDIYENGTDTTSNLTVANITKGNSDKVKDTDALFANYNGAKVQFVDTNNDGNINRVCVTYSYIAKVTKVTAATSSKDRFVTLDIWNDNAGTKYTAMTYTTDEFEKDDYVMVYPNEDMAASESWTTQLSTAANIIKVEKIANVVTGKVSGTTQSSGNVTAITLDGTSYKVASDALATMGNSGAQLVKAGSYNYNNTEYTLYLNNGYVVGSVGANAAKDISNIVYVVAKPDVTKDTYGANVYNVQYVELDGTIKTGRNFATDNYANTADSAGTDSGNDLAAGFYYIWHKTSDDTYKFAPVTLADLSAGVAANIDNDNTYYVVAETSGNPFAMKSSSKTVAVRNTDDADSATAYLLDTSTLLFASGTGSSLKVTTATGPKAQSIAQESLVLLSRDGSNYTVSAMVIGAEQTSTDGARYWLDATERGTNADGTYYRLYDLTTGEYTTITGDKSSEDSLTKYVSGAFVTYTQDADGVYSFTNVGPVAASDKNGDGVYVLTEADVSVYNELLTTSNAGNLSQMETRDASAVTIINLPK